MTDLTCLFNILHRHLTRDLLSPKWAMAIPPHSHPVSGHCAIAAEALYHILGGKDAGYMPMVCKYHFNTGCIVRGPGPDPKLDETHWWLRGPQNGLRGAGSVIDPTAQQYNAPFPYDWGRGCAFMAPNGKPSKRAQILIDRMMPELSDL